MRKKLTVTRHLKSGKVVKYKTKDRGKPGRTPASDRWFKGFDVETGWNENDSTRARREEVLKAMNGDTLKAARHLQELANLTADATTKRKAKADADFFFAEYDREK